MSDTSANAYAANINAAIDPWRTRTPIQFIPRTTETAFVRFMGSTGNNSNVGRTGSAQNINIVTRIMGVIGLSGTWMNLIGNAASVRA